MADFTVQGKISIDTSGLQAGVSAAKLQLEGMAGSATSALGPLGGVLSAMGPIGLAAGAAAGALVLAGGALGAAAVKAMDLGGRMTDLSAKTGLSVVALQGLGHVGSLVGVSTETIAGGITKMQRSLVEGSEAFGQLGLKVGELRALRPEDAFAAIAEKIMTIKDPAGQAAAAMEIFGKSGAALLPVMKENIARVQAEMQRLGATMSKESVAAADALGDSITTLGRVWDGLVMNLGSAVTESAAVHAAIEGMTEILGVFSNGAKDGQGFLQSLVDNGVILFAEALSVATGAVGVAIDAWTTMKVVLAALKMEFEVVGLAAIAAAEIVAAPTKAKESWDNFKRAVADAGARAKAEVAAQVESNTKWHNALAQVNVKVDEMKAKVKDAAGAKVKLKTDADAARQTLDFVGKSAEDVDKKSLAMAKSILKAAEDSKELKFHLSQGAEGMKLLTESAVEALPINDRYADSMLKLAKGWTDFGEQTRPPIKLVTEETKGAEKATFDWSKALQNVKATMDVLGISSQSTFGQLVGRATAAAAAGEQMKSAYDSKNWVAFGTSAAQAFAGIIKGATESQSAVESIFSGAASGASAGSIFGPKGAAIGAAAGATIAALASGFKALFGSANDEAMKAEAASLRAAAAIQVMTDRAAAHKAAVEEVRAAMDRYGITVDEMGPKWAQQELNSKAQGLLQDYALLTAAGADHNLVIDKMGPALNEYVQTSIKAGTEIPANMRPILEKMLEAGLLTDDTGQKMESLGGLTFAETLEGAIGGLSESIRLLITALNDIPNINRTVTIETVQVGKVIDPDTGIGVPGGRGGSNDLPQAARGGVSTAPTPMMLHGTPSNPELIGPADALARSIGESIAVSLSGGGGSNVFVVSEGGQLRQPSIAEVQRVQRMFDSGQISVPARAVSARG